MVANRNKKVLWKGCVTVAAILFLVVILWNRESRDLSFLPKPLASSFKILRRQQDGNCFNRFMSERYICISTAELNSVDWEALGFLDVPAFSYGNSAKRYVMEGTIEEISITWSTSHSEVIITRKRAFSWSNPFSGCF